VLPSVNLAVDDAQASVLVVMGEKEQDRPESVAEVRFVAEALNAELLLVPDAGRYPVAEYPELFSPTVIELADRVHARA
jgi:pimeloyl-ACP methyl ester carboxylesterase